MISTPQTAYQWLLDLGLSHEDAAKLTESREKFEFYVKSLEACMAVLNV